MEDEPADAELFIELMGEMSHGIAVHHVSNGQEALNFLARGSGYGQATLPDLIVLDLNMPVMSGHEFLKRAKNDDRARAIPVLVLSTSDDPRDIQKAYHEYASGYVVKPGNFSEYRELLNVIEGYWRGAVRLPTVEQMGGIVADL